MHLAGAAEFSIFRRTLAAILRPVIGLANENDPLLSEWMSAHLQASAIAVTDANLLGQIEAAVLDNLDPPLNLTGRPAGPLRARLAELRRERKDVEHPNTPHPTSHSGGTSGDRDRAAIPRGHGGDLRDRQARARI
jgi:hypothetical protein